MITAPADGTLIGGPTMVSGYCWSAVAPVARVEVSVDGGHTWSDAAIGPALSGHAWRRWEREWTPSGPGEATLIARAWTTDGEVQPLKSRRTALGYMNNAARAVRVRVGAAT